MDYAKILGGASCPIDSYCLNGGTCVFYAAIGELSCRYVKAIRLFFTIPENIKGPFYLCSSYTLIRDETIFQVLHWVFGQTV